ncbi:DEAD/DEAH box helicase family protein [Helicobacter pylori]
MSCKIHSHLLPPPPQSAIKDHAPNSTPNNAPNNEEIDLPTHITSNLKKELRDYQKQAIHNYLEKRQFNPTQKHFMFEMATGSGKTLVMAGLILECYKQGYQNFIFFVNSASILEKTKLNFTDSVSSKYLFSENININDKNTEIKSINNLNESHNNAINIYFSTIQGLFSLFTRAKENAITLEDLKDQKLVFLADEAHHLNTETKKKLNDNEASEKRNWESVVKLALEQNKDNLLLEFSATIPKEKSVEEKYKNLKVVTYTLKEFSEDKFCKNIYSLSYWELLMLDKIVLFCGKYGCGKTTLANTLYKELVDKGYSCFKHSFATPLKQMLGDLLHAGFKNNADLKNESVIFKDKLISCRSLLQNLGDIIRSVDRDYFIKHVGFELKHYKKGIVIIDDLRFYNELVPLVSFAKRLYIVGIDSDNANNENSAELKHASENYDELKGLIKRFQLKHNSVAWLELGSFVNRDIEADKDLLLDFVGL